MDRGFRPQLGLCFDADPSFLGSEHHLDGAPSFLAFEEGDARIGNSTVGRADLVFHADGSESQLDFVPNGQPMKTKANKSCEATGDNVPS